MRGSAKASRLARLLTALRFLGVDLRHNLARTLLAVAALAAVIASYLVIVAGAAGFAQFAPYFATPQPNLWLMSAGVLTPINSSSVGSVVGNCGQATISARHTGRKGWVPRVSEA